jgi:hypothetical protein
MMNAVGAYSYRRGKEDIWCNRPTGRARMSIVEAFLLGLMTAWTPSLILLAWMLRREAGSKNQPSDMQH